MGGKQYKGRTGKLPPFVAVPYDLLNSKAYLELSFAAKSALTLFLGKPKVPFNRPGYFATDFTLTYPEASRHGYAKATFSSVIKQLVRYGFIDPVDKGGLRGFGKSSSRFCMSARWQDFGTAKFISKEWQEFQPREAS